MAVLSADELKPSETESSGFDGPEFCGEAREGSVGDTAGGADPESSHLGSHLYDRIAAILLVFLVVLGGFCLFQDLSTMPAVEKARIKEIVRLECQIRELQLR